MNRDNLEMRCWNPNDTLTFRSPVARKPFRNAVTSWAIARAEAVLASVGGGK